MRFNVQFTEDTGETEKMFTLLEGVRAMSAEWSFIHSNMKKTRITKRLKYISKNYHSPCN